MNTLRKWLARVSMPDLGDTQDGAQHGRLVRMDGRSYRLRRVEHLPAGEHAEVTLTFSPGHAGDGFESWRDK